MLVMLSLSSHPGHKYGQQFALVFTSRYTISSHEIFHAPNDSSNFTEGRGPKGTRCKLIVMQWLL